MNQLVKEYISRTPSSDNLDNLEWKPVNKNVRLLQWTSM